MILSNGTDFRLPANTKAAWVKRLRSGLSQTTGRLCKIEEDGGKSYCCLGVLAEQKRLFVSTEVEAYTDGAKVKKIKMYAEDENESMFGGGLNGKHAGYLSTRTLPVEVQSILAKMNDDGKRFPFIADWIEGNL